MPRAEPVHGRDNVGIGSAGEATGRFVRRVGRGGTVLGGAVLEILLGALDERQHRLFRRCRIAVLDGEAASTDALGGNVAVSTGRATSCFAAMHALS